MDSAPTHLRDRVYPALGARRRAVIAWCLFDFANSSYTTLIITVAFSVYFREVVVNAGDNSGDRLWGIANFIAMLVVALSSTVIGAAADHAGRKKLLLTFTTVQTVIATCLLYFVGPGQVVRAMALYVVATIGFELGYVFYNSFLPEVSTPRTIGRISGWAWGVGYVGGLAALLLCSPFLTSELRDAAGGLIDSAVTDRQLSFLIVGLFYLVFALPAFLWLRETRTHAATTSLARLSIVGLRRVVHTLRHLRDHRQAGKFVVASLFYNDGITTIIIFSAVFATATFGFTMAEVVRLFLVLNVVAIPGALFAGYLADRIGSRPTILLSLVLWIAVVITGYMAQTRLAFWIMASGAAIGMGSTQAVSRAYMAQLSPKDRESEFFGFYVLSGKFASIFGPLLFGMISAYTGSQRLAVLSLLPLFIIGLLIMLTIDDRQVAGIAPAKRA